jgi:predicted nucleotidyltransferase
MKLFKQLTEQAALAQVRQTVYGHASFPNGFSHLMESLEIAGLADSDSRSRKVGSTYLWTDKRTRNGVMIETNAHPYTTPHVNMTVSGNKDALEIFESILELQGVQYDGKESSLPKITHEYHDALNPALWEQTEDGYTLKEDIKEALMDIAAEFIDFQKMTALEIEDITVTGSCANYNWTPKSDIDLHMIVDFKKTTKQYGPLVPEYFEAKRKVWSDLHDIKIHGIPVEPYIQNKDEKHHSTAVYSLVDDSWIIEPTHEEPTIDDAAIKTKLKQLMREIDDVVTANRAGPVEALMTKIKNMRKAGLESGGEFATDNLIFKELRRNGYFEKLAECKTKVYDRELSIEDEEWTNLTQGD